MPSKQAGGGGGRRGVKKAPGASPATSSITASYNDDPLHNSDQPCCQILTDMARQIFPVTALEKEYCAKHHNGEKKSPPPILAQLLREYLLSERQRQKQQEKQQGSSNKKKRKKKKKKKGGSVAGSTQSGAAVEADEKRPESPSQSYLPLSAEGATATITTTTSTTENDTSAIHSENGGTQVSSSLPPAIQDDTETKVAPSVFEAVDVDDQLGRDHEDRRQMLQQERRRRIQVLLGRFLDSRTVPPQMLVNNNGDSTSSGFVGGDSNSGNLQQLHDFFQTLTDQDYKSVPSSANSKQVSTWIPAKDVQEALHRIKCLACRRDAERVLLPDMRPYHPHDSQLLLEGAHISTVYDAYQQERELEDQTLHYQLLMEEGTKPPELSHEWSFVLDTIQPNGVNGKNPAARPEILGWQLCRPEVIRETSSPERNCWTMNDLDFLLQQYVLLLGLPPDAITGASSATSGNFLADSVVDSVADSVETKSHTLVEEVKTMAERLAKGVENFGATRNTAQHGNVDWKDFPIMKEADESCDVVLDNSLRIIFEVTRSVQRILTHLGGGVFQGDEAADDSNVGTAAFTHTPMTRHEAVSDSHWAVKQCIALWETYLEGVRNIWTAMDEYHKKVFELADGKGQIPEMFVSSTARDLFRSFVDSKIRVAHHLIDRIHKRMDHPTHIGGWSCNASTTNSTTFAHRLFAEEAFYQVISGQEQRNHIPKLPVDQACEDVFTTVRELSEIVHGPSVHNLMETHNQRRDKFFRLVSIVVDNVDMLASESSSRYGRPKDGATDLRNIRNVMNLYTQQRPLEDLSPEIWMESMAEFHLRVGEGLSKAVANWVLYRLDYEITGYEKRIPPVMPMKLRRRARPGGYGGILMDGTHLACVGGNGRCRAICILVGIFFQQLSDGFKEWQAQAAAQELLTIEDDEQAQTSTTTTKKSKKKNKRKIIRSDSDKMSEKKQGEHETSQSLENNRDLAENQKPDDSIVESPQDWGKCSSCEANHLAPSDLPDGNVGHVMPSTEVSVNGLSADLERTNDRIADQRQTKLSLTAVTTNHCQVPDSLDRDTISSLYSSVHVVVHEKSGFQTAENFLVGRLSAQLNAEEDIIII